VLTASAKPGITRRPIHAGADLSPRGHCTVSVSFSPTTTGAQTGSITISDNTPNSPQVISLSGSGVNGPFFTALPHKLNFGTQTISTSSASQSVSLVNTGNAILTLANIGVGGANSSDFSATNNCNGALAAGASCRIAIIFTPAASGSRSATLSITGNASDSPQNVTLSGTGAGLALGPAAGSSSSATVQAGGSASFTLSIGGAGITGQANLTCQGAPAGANCSFPSGPTIAVNAITAAQFIVKVTTQASSTAFLSPTRAFPFAWFPALGLAGALVLPGISVRQMIRRRLLGLFAVMLVLLLCSCGGGGGSSSLNNGASGAGGTPPGVYNLVVSASSGTVTESVPVTLTVQ
jgi:Abnormal spindle-like microcephaly-assoc'd, ASPM-SPD-2-Hydin